MISELLIAVALAQSPVKVVTSLPDLAWATRQIGGDKVAVSALLSGTENPHYVDAIPKFIREVADAQIVCTVGLDLEIGYMPKILARSGNAKVQPGSPGYCETGRAVEVLEKPTGPVNRAMGDLHPSGNPHYWLSPKAMADGAKEIRDALGRVDPAHRAAYEAGYQALAARLDAIAKRNRAKLAPVLAKVTGPVVIEYHREFVYLFAEYDIRSRGSIEEKPGVPPSAGRIAQVALAAKSAGVKVALGGSYAPTRIMDRFRELSGVPTLILPTALRQKGGITDYEELQDHLVDAIVKAVKP